MDNRYNARYRNTDNRGAPNRRPMMEDPAAAPNGFRNDYRGNWYAGQTTMQGRNPMEATRDMRQNYCPSAMDTRMGQQNVQKMQPGMRTGQNTRQGMPQNRMRQQSGMRRPQEQMGQIYGMPQGGPMGPMSGQMGTQMGQPYGTRQAPGGMGMAGGPPWQRGSYMNPMAGGVQPNGDMNNR